MAIVEEEADEAAYWMELIVAAGMMKEPLLSDLLAEANELTAIASIKTARKQLENPRT